MDVDRSRLPAVVSIPLVEAPPNLYSINERCDLSIHTKYLNYSGRTIRMGTRNGVIYDLPAQSDRLSQDFIVRQEMHISDNLTSSVRNRLISFEGIESADLKAFKKQFLEAYRDRRHGVILKFDHRTTAHDINHQGGSIYVTELDIILSTRQDNIPLHPWSLEAMSHTPRSVRTIDDTGVSIVVIDSDDTIGAIYVRLLGKIIRIDPIKNALKPNGVYISHRGVTESQRGELIDFVDFIPQADMDDVSWLNKSFMEAKNAPDREAEFGIRLKEMDLEGKRITAESLLLKNEYEHERIQLEQKNTELQREIDEQNRRYSVADAERQRLVSEEEHRSKIEQIKTRDFYEERSTSRKDTSELVKFIPALLIGAGAAYATLRGLFK